jgi:hypothetical protein
MNDGDEGWIAVLSPGARDLEGRRHSMTNPFLSLSLLVEQSAVRRAANRSQLMLPPIRLTLPSRMLYRSPEI